MDKVGDKDVNNYEKIKSMSVDELAEWIKSNFLHECDYCTGCELGLPPLYSEKCIVGIKQWLLAEVEE